MSMSTRDLEALDLARSRSLGPSYLASFDLDMQARRSSVRFYGRLGGQAGDTFLATLTFFGVGELGLDNADGTFPDSASVATVDFADYEEVSERGFVEVRGAQGWVLSWSYDGLAYEEHPTVLASLADETA
jgi:hypothetical protein